MWEILHRESGVAESRNSLLSPRGRPSPSLLERTLSELAGVLTLCINLSLFSTFDFDLPLSTSYYQLLLCSRSLALPRPVSAHAALGCLGRNSASLFSVGFLYFGGLKISIPILLFNRGSYPFSSFGNLILA
jgi:hypothetical protein